MKLCVNHLTYNPDEKTYMCYISKMPEGFNPFQKLWDDSDEEGFILKAHSDPSMYVEFMWGDTEYENDSISEWVFVAVPNERTMRMGMLDTKIRIINF